MNMLKAWQAKARQATMDRAFTSGALRCPKCGQKPATVPADMQTLVRCQSCGFDAFPAEWRLDAGGVPEAQPDKIPHGTQIRREKSFSGQVVWHIPASGKFGFFLFFGLAWVSITALVSGGFLLGSDTEAPADNPWFLYLFFTIFWAVGIGTLYVGVRNKYASHRITITPELVTLRRDMFGRSKEKSLATPTILSVAQVVFYQQNYQPVYGVEIRGPEGKLRFGTTLREDEKAWLVANLKLAIFGEIRAKPVVAAQRHPTFSFPLPASPGWHWIPGCFLLLCGLASVAFGVSRWPDFTGHGTEGKPWGIVVFDAIFDLFGILPIVVGLAFSGVGVLIIVSSWPGLRREIRLEGDEAQVALRTFKGGRLVKERTFPRASVTGARALHAGDMNGKTMKSILLIVDRKTERLTRWTDGEAADAWADAVSGALGPPASLPDGE